MATIGDGLCVIGVALIICAFFSPIIVSELKNHKPSDYEICIKSCPKSFSGYYEDLECPKMCADTVFLHTSNSTSLTFPTEKEFNKDLTENQK